MTANILIVDDEVDTCANLQDIFTDLGYHVDVAHDGTSALELVQKNHYDVALLDLRMPGMDGLELYRRIRQVSASTVAIVVTAYASSETARSVLEAGAWRILSKPVDFSELLKLVSDALEQPLVLLVDDDKDLCDSLWDLFREHQLRVCLAHDVTEANQHLKDLDFQVVIIDMKLPRGSGIEVLQSVRQANPKARTLLITGFRQELDHLIREAMSAGADAVCYKPFDIPRLLETLKKLSQSNPSVP
jgi:two-component system response regulator HydG